MFDRQQEANVKCFYTLVPAPKLEYRTDTRSSKRMTALARRTELRAIYNMPCVCRLCQKMPQLLRDS